jgi:hypothetical protein
MRTGIIVIGILILAALSTAAIIVPPMLKGPEARQQAVAAVAAGGEAVVSPASVDASAASPAAGETPSPTPEASASPNLAAEMAAAPKTPPPPPAPPPPRLPNAAQQSNRNTYSSAPDIVWGVNGHPFTAYPNITMEAQLDAVTRLGMSHYRVNLRPDGSTRLLDQLIRIAEPRRITILPIIASPASLENDTPEQIYAKSFEIARSLSRRYAGRVKVWELGNEVENFAIIQPCEMRDDGTKYPCEWGPAGGVGPLEYFGPRWRKVSAMLHGMADGVHAGDPAALRAIGTAGWGHVGAFDRMAADGIPWEISVWHQYEFGQEDFLAKVASFGKPIWITEFNYSEGSRRGEGDQATALVAMMSRHREVRAAYRIEAVFIYELFDEPYWTGIESQMGLARLVQDSRGFWNVGADKPAFESVRALIAAGPQSRQASSSGSITSR